LGFLDNSSAFPYNLLRIVTFVKSFLEKMKQTNILSLENLVALQNPWFTYRGNAPAEKFLPKRAFYRDFKKLVEETRQISALTGIRRVGKTVILRQLLAEKLENPANLPLYFSFDQEILSTLKNPLAAIIDYYLNQILDKKLTSIRQTVWLFFDEIQLVPFWQDTLKRYYDLNQNLKFVISGSSSLFLQEKSQESLAGRIFEEILPPLTFSEYKKIKKIASGEEPTAFGEYLRFGGFFEEIELAEEERKKEFLREWVLGKVLERDLPRLLHLPDYQILRALFYAILGAAGQNVVLSKIASDLDLSPTTITNYLAILEKTLLLSSVLNLSGSFVRRERRLRKIYPASADFLGLLPIFPPNLGAMAETYVFNILKNVFREKVFFFQQRGLEIDFVLPEKRVVAETKFQEKIHPEDYRKLRAVMKRKKYQTGFLLTKNLTEEREFPEGLIISLPVWQLESLNFQNVPVNLRG
jgi:predicted AAA+ superfamily ATPase